MVNDVVVALYGDEWLLDLTRWSFHNVYKCWTTMFTPETNIIVRLGWVVSVSVLPQTHPPISDAETAVFLWGLRGSSFLTSAKSWFGEKLLPTVSQQPACHFIISANRVLVWWGVPSPRGHMMDLRSHDTSIPLSDQISRLVVSDSLQPHESHTPALPVHHQLLKFPKFMSIASVMLSSQTVWITTNCGGDGC